MNIVHKRDHTPTPSDVYVGRPSPLGNPYSHLPIRGTIQVANRDLAVEHYGRWLLSKIREADPKVLEALAALTPDSTLVCFCAPQRCHAEMIERAWKWLAQGGQP